MPVAPNGAIYTENADGTVTIMGYQDAPIGGPNPAVANDAERLRLAQEAAARQAANDAQVNADRQEDNARADRTLAIAEGRATQTANGAMTSAQRMEQQGRVSRLAQLAQQINRTQELFNDGPGTTSGLGGVLDYFPTDANAAFDVAGASLAQQGLAAFRVPGTGTVSDRDAMMFDRANLPTASTRDSAVQEQLNGMRARVEAEMQALGIGTPEWTNVPQDEEQPRPNAMTINRAISGGAPPTIEPGGGTTRDPASPEVQQAHADLIARLMAQNGGRLDPQQYAQTVGEMQRQLLPNSEPRDPAADAAWATENNQYLDQGGNTINTDLSTERNISASRQELGRMLGEGGETALLNVLDMGGFGGVSALAGDRMGALNESNPGAALVGQIGGAITGTSLLRRLGSETLGRAVPGLLGGGRGANFARNLANDVGYSAIQGGVSGQGATGNAVEGGMGSVLGQLVGGTVGKIAKGVDVSPAVEYLRQRGVPLTVGQTLGGNARRLEDAATSLPFVGGQINSRFDDGLQGVNRAAFDVGAETTGLRVPGTGSDGLRQLHSMGQQQYSAALDPVTLDIAGDPMALDDIAAALETARTIPQVGENAAEALQYRIAGGAPEGTMAGRDFQEAYRGLGRSGREAAAGPYASEFAGVMGQGQDALSGALERQNPGAFDQFLDANTTHRRLRVLADAVNAAKNQTDEIFTPAQLNAADANSATRLTGRVNSATGARPFHELATNAQEVMGNRLPNSGTADRAAMMAGLGGLAAVGGGAGYATTGDMQGAAAGGATIPTIAMLLALAGGTKGGQKLLTGALTQRPENLRRLGEWTSRNRHFAGSAAIPLALMSESGL